MLAFGFAWKLFTWSWELVPLICWRILQYWKSHIFSGELAQTMLTWGQLVASIFACHVLALLTQVKVLWIRRFGTLINSLTFLLTCCFVFVQVILISSKHCRGITEKLSLLRAHTTCLKWNRRQLFQFL